MRISDGYYVTVSCGALFNNTCFILKIVNTHNVDSDFYRCDSVKYLSENRLMLFMSVRRTKIIA